MAQPRGPLGESLAQLFLESRGYVILGKNLRVGRREVDLLAERGRMLIAVEVKWRREGGADEAWRRPQRARAGEAVLGLMERWPGAAERPWRFDLVAIEESARGWTLVHRPGAWSPGDSFW
jgi:putative endonuclease